MNRLFPGIFGVLAACALLVLAPEPARAQSFQFTKVVDSSQGFDPFDFGCSAINDRNDVVFRATRTDSTTVIVRVNTSNRATLIASDRTTFDFLGRNPSINNAGDVSFAATLETGGEAVLKGRGGALTTIAETENGPFNFFAFDTWINNLGQVAFTAELDDFDEGLFAGSGGPVTTYFLTSTSPFADAFSGPSINDAGQVALDTTLDTGEQGVFRIQPDGSFVTIADDSGPISFVQYPSINAQGVVAFQAFLDDGGAAIYTGTGGPLTTIADTSGQFASFGFNTPSINDSGVVAFTAFLDNGQQGLFVRSGSTMRRVIRTGDPLDGSTVTNIVFCREGLNNNNQLTFNVNLEDERTAVYRAAVR
jgi:hypothetical protein